MKMILQVATDEMGVNLRDQERQLFVVEFSKFFSFLINISL